VPSIRGDNALGAGNDGQKLRLRANGGSIQRHTRAQQESDEGLIANAIDGTTVEHGWVRVRRGLDGDKKMTSMICWKVYSRAIFPTLA
jgi:hypothetical protein